MKDNISDKQLANDHWAWLRQVLELEHAHCMALVEQLYKDAFVHGYKHAEENKNEW